MKKSILLLLVVVCIAAITFVSCKEPEPEAYTEVEYYEDGTTLKSVTEIQRNGTPSKKTEYDKNGNIIKLTYYRSGDSSLFTYITYEYDSANRMTKETHYGYFGEIYYFSTHEYDADGNKTVTNFGDKGIVNSKTVYDASGNKLKETAFNSDGTIKTITDADGNIKWYNKYYNDGSKDTIYEYDDDGNLTKETKYDYERISYCTEYDTDGKKTTTYKEDGSVDRLREYDSLGNPIRSTVYFYNGYYGVSEYDSTGNIIKVTSYSPEGTRIDWKEYEYDSNGNETMYKYYDDYNGYLIFWEEYEYHSNGEKSKETSYYDDGTIKKILEYYSDGKKSKETTYDSDGKSQVQEYDTNGNRIKYIYFNSDGSIYFLHEYDYDSNGNATKQTRYNPDGTIKDIIEYGGSAGLAIKYTAYRADGSVLFVHECSSANCYLEIGTWSDPPVGGSGIVIYEYDNNDRLTKGTFYYSDGSIQSVKTY